MKVKGKFDLVDGLGGRCEGLRPKVTGDRPSGLLFFSGAPRPKVNARSESNAAKVCFDGGCVSRNVRFSSCGGHFGKAGIWLSRRNCALP